jgi:ABC-2 type transport system permease protein
MLAMLAKLLELIGVDAVQWRVLVLTALRVDLRMTSAMSMSRAHVRGSGKSSLRGFLITLGFMGLVFGLLVYAAADLFFSSTLFFSFLLFSVGSSLLLEYQAIVLSPDDYRQLGYQPITSRTFFAARLTSVLIYVWLMAFALGIFPCIAAAFNRHGGPIASIALFLAAVLASTTAALFVIGVYGWLLKLLPASRLKHALTYLQLAATFLVYASYFMLPRLIGERALQQFSMPHTGWILAVPGTWYASFIVIANDLAHGVGLSETPGAHLMLAGATILLAIVAAMISGGRLSLDYADRLADLMIDSASDAQTAATPVRAGRLFRDGERRAVALLVRGLFRHDMKFRLGVLGIVPLTIIYLFGGFGGHGGVTDPFVVGSKHGEPQLVYYAVLFFPTMLRQVMSRSDAYRAAWIFFATPADTARLVLAVKDFVLAYFVLPYLAFLGVLLAYWFPRLDHLAILLLTLALLCHLVLLVQLLLNPELPFSQPETKGGRSQVMILVIALSAVAVMLPTLLHAAFATPVRVLATLTGFVAVNLLLQKATVARVQRLARAAEVQL